MADCANHFSPKSNEAAIKNFNARIAAQQEELDGLRREVRMLKISNEALCDQIERLRAQLWAEEKYIEALDGDKITFDLSEIVPND